MTTATAETKDRFAIKPATLKRALGDFELIKGAGSEGEQRACAMTLLTWMCGREWDSRKKQWVEVGETKEWTDHPECAHPLIANAVIEANDAPDTTTEQQAELVKLGVKGVLDTWWIPVEVVACALAGEEGESLSEFEVAVRLLKRIVAWKKDRQKPNLTGAHLTGVNLRDVNLTGAYLTGANLRDANLTGANLTGANLRDANLTGANLTGANLTGANLTGANLTGARGLPFGGMPDGWVQNDAGLWVRVRA